MTSSGSNLVATYITSSCSGTEEEHEYLVQKLITLCERDGECVTRNMQRMTDLCHLASLTNILKFYKKCEAYKTHYDVTHKMLIVHLMDTMQIPRSSIEHKYERSKNAHDILQNIEAKYESWNAWIEIRNISNFPTLNPDTNLLVTFFQESVDDWRVLIQVVTNHEDGTVVDHYTKELIAFRSDQNKITKHVKRHVRDIFENRFSVRVQGDGTERHIVVGKMMFEFTEIDFS
jgi:hypothetical protein